MKALGQTLAAQDTPLLQDAGEAKWRSVFTPGTRRMMNSFPMLINVLVPWAFFIFTFILWSFRFHFTRGAWLPYVGFALALCCAVPLLIGEYHRKIYTDPTWWRASFVLMCLAVGSGYALGDMNYWSCMLSYYTYSALEAYPQVDVGHELGVNLLDAGRVYFGENAMLVQDKAWHFKDGTLYCVAPIGSKAGMEKDTYDFWAVGTDCCSEVSSDFRCGEFMNPRARAGLRLMDSGTLPMYRLAVNQAMVEFNIHATTPLFFTWTQDPLNDIAVLLETGYMHFQVACLGALVTLVLLVVMLSCLFARIGRKADPHPAALDAP